MRIVAKQLLLKNLDQLAATAANGSLYVSESLQLANELTEELIDSLEVAEDAVA
jgi:hypothetical protein